MATKTETPATDLNKTCKAQTQGQKAQLSASASCDQATEQTEQQVCCEKVQERAYYKWEQAGRPEGDGVNFWFEAKAELQAELQAETPE